MWGKTMCRDWEGWGSIIKQSLALWQAPCFLVGHKWISHKRHHNKVLRIKFGLFAGQKIGWSWGSHRRKCQTMGIKTSIVYGLPSPLMVQICGPIILFKMTDGVVRNVNTTLCQHCVINYAIQLTSLIRNTIRASQNNKWFLWAHHMASQSLRRCIEVVKSAESCWSRSWMATAASNTVIAVIGIQQKQQKQQQGCVWLTRC